MNNKLSTSALAREMDLSTGQLFKVLQDFAWINKTDDGWVLSAKGEFEGGEYVHSKRYGRYIVWPRQLSEHPLIKALEDQRTVSASQLAQEFQLSPREINRSLAELGWIRHTSQGWELLEPGEQRGGIQLENQNSGNFYVVWPEGINSDSELRKLLNWVNKQVQNYSGDAADLFSQPENLKALDGHQPHSVAHLMICHWLYIAGLAHACDRLISGSDDLVADFYLPVINLYIDVWSDSQDAKTLSRQLSKREFYQSQKLDVIELEKEDLPMLDDILTRELRKRGLRIF